MADFNQAENIVRRLRFAFRAQTEMHTPVSEVTFQVHPEYHGDGAAIAVLSTNMMQGRDLKTIYDRVSDAMPEELDHIPIYEFPQDRYIGTQPAPARLSVVK